MRAGPIARFVAGRLGESVAWGESLCQHAACPPGDGRSLHRVHAQAGRKASCREGRHEMAEAMGGAQSERRNSVLQGQQDKSHAGTSTITGILCACRIQFDRGFLCVLFVPIT